MAKKALTDIERRELLRIGRKIRAAREAKDWTQSDLVEHARKSGVGLSLRRLQAIEAAEHNPSMTTVMGILAVLRAKRGDAFDASPGPVEIDAHQKLQELLDAPEPWPTAARINVDAVYLLYQTGATALEGINHKARPPGVASVPGRRSVSST